MQHPLFACAQTCERVNYELSKFCVACGKCRKVWLPRTLLGLIHSHIVRHRMGRVKGQPQLRLTIVVEICTKQLQRS